MFFDSLSALGGCFTVGFGGQTTRPSRPANRKQNRKPTSRADLESKQRDTVRATRGFLLIERFVLLKIVGVVALASGSGLCDQQSHTSHIDPDTSKSPQA